MRIKPAMTLGVLGPAVGFSAFIVAFQLQASVSAMPVRGMDPAPVNRTLKSDRLPVVPAAVRPLQRSEHPSLPEGCVELSGWNQDTMYDNEIPGRCIG